MPRAALRTLLLLATLGACASNVGPGDIERLPSNTKVYLDDVYFDYATWVRVSSDEKDQARKMEPEWAGAIRDGFLAEARKLGILGKGPGARKVTIAMVDTYPGSVWSNDLIGYGSGRAKANADVTIKDHGTFEMTRVVPNDNVVGELNKLGVEIARYINRKMR
ncbi:MAG: hypothetical protein ACYTGZ_03615 [Planctomycetota bacterium]|jgi:hypothetical protein